MPSKQRQYLRFSLDIPAYFCGRLSEKYPTAVQQISIGGCLLPARKDLFPGDEFRLEMELPNGNFIPLACKAIYSVGEFGMGAKFLEITKFEQELLAHIILSKLESENMPIACDPMVAPPRLFDRADSLKITDAATVRESMLEELMAVDSD